MSTEDHAEFRRLIEPSFSAERMAALEPGGARGRPAPVCRTGAGGDGSAGCAGADAVSCDAGGDLGARFAVRAMMRWLGWLGWLGWPGELEPTLLEWMADNQAATRSGTLEATAAVARRYDEIIASVLEPGRVRGAAADGEPDDVTTENLVYGTGPHVCPGRPLATPELSVAVEEIVAAFEDIALDPGARPERSTTPTGGYASVPVVLTPAR